jgi:hypothetical protein
MGRNEMSYVWDFVDRVERRRPQKPSSEGATELGFPWPADKAFDRLFSFPSGHLEIFKASVRG